MIEFEWDPRKAKKNFKKHKVSFAEAATVLHDPLGITVFDPEHSEEEERFISMGMAKSSRVLMVAHTDRENRIRIISARKLDRMERKAYEKEIQRRNA